MMPAVAGLNMAVKLVAAPDHYHLVVPPGANEVGAQPTDQAHHDSAEYRTLEADNVKTIHKPASQIEHAPIED